MTTDDIYIEAFKVGDRYRELLDRTVSSVMDVAEEHIKDGKIEAYTLTQTVESEADERVAGWVGYALAATLHFGIFNVVNGCDWDESPMRLFEQEVYDAVVDKLGDMDVQVV